MRTRVGLRAFAALLAAGLAWLPSPAAAARFGAIDFQPCELSVPGTVQTLRADCASHEVSENPADPAGRKIRLRLARIAARAAKPQPDWVVYLAGGPGQSAVDSFGSIASGFQALLRNRNVLLVDQRGTGGSNALRCPPIDFDAERMDDPATLRRRTVQCLDAVSTHADPRFYTTSDAVRDLESVRHALGDPRFDLVGGSYGTRMALTYLQQFPQAIRSVVLDSVVPQDEVLGQHHARNLDTALRRIFDDCRADSACAGRFGDPSATLTRLRAELRRQPRTVDLDDPRTQAPRRETLTESSLAAVLRIYAYQSASAALLPLLIDEAANGRPQALLAQGLLLYDDLQTSLAAGLSLSVSCAEDVPFFRRTEDDAGTLLGNRLTDGLAAQCAVWPRGAVPDGFKQPVRSDTPVLLLAGARDPVTPPADAQRAAATLPKSRVLVVPGAGHIVLREGCVPRLAARFVETLDPAALDAQCLDALGPAPTFVSVQGPSP